MLEVEPKDTKGPAIDIITELIQKHGVEIPKSPDDKYRFESRNSMLFYNCVVSEENILPTDNEMNVIMECIAHIPGAGYLAGLIIPYRKIPYTAAYIKNIEDSIVPNAYYLGYEWPYLLNNLNTKNIPRDRLASNKSAILLCLSHKSPSDVVKGNGTYCSYPGILGTTQKDFLRFILAHEYGHAFDDQVRMAGSQTIGEYINRSYNKSDENYLTFDIDHPIYESFARLTGWKLMTYSDYIKKNLEINKLFGFGKKIEEYDQNKLRNKIWVKDERAWGEIGKRNNRNWNGSSNPESIEECFADFWACSIICPDELTENEREYFGKIHRGLQTTPKDFIQSIADRKIDLNAA